MAELAVSFAVEKMGDMLIRKAIFLEGVQKQVDRLKTELKRMLCFLKDADARQQEEERVRNWVSEIRDLACQAEDAIDLYISNVAEAGKSKFFAFRISKKLVSCWKMGKQIEDIQMKTQDIRMSLETYGIRSIGEATSPAGQRLQKLRYISPLLKENIVVGLQQETDGLVKQLVGRDERRRVVSIVGMGGIGKTTLAKKVYNDSRVLQHFQSYRAWVYVSEDCRPRDVFQEILNRIPYFPTEAKTEKFQENELGDFLHEHLMGKRFLVVLDDIWNSDDWKCLARAFPVESNGSRLLLTTRNTEVALQADARSAPHHLQVLSEEESWKLFCRTAIPEIDTDSCPPGLEKFGEKMVKKCGGLPLAIVVLGGLLSCKPRSPAVWENVLNNLQEHFASANGVDAILSLSYVDLPHNLKSCFLYMGLFPEDRVIPKRRLLHLWIAEGFFPQEEDGQRREGRAEEYLNELINRNLVQAAKVSVNERVTQCRIHDLVRDLCIKKSKELNFFEILVSSTSPKSRRLGIYHDMDSYASRQPSTPYIRSILFFETVTMKKRCCVNLSDSDFKLLRVLDLGDVDLTLTTIRFGKLIHLRYLRFKVGEDLNSYHPSLPNCWGTWWSDHLYLPTSLQALTFESSMFSHQHPYQAYVSRVVHKLENLQHLFLFSVAGEHEPLRIEHLSNLQTLSWICLSNWLQNDTRELTSLRKLKILVDNVDAEAVEGEFSNSIANCENLRSLYLEASSFRIEIPSFVMGSWFRLSKLQMKGSIQKLPEAHEFPPNLTQLTLEHTWLGNESMMILEKLPRLLTLRFTDTAFEEVQVSEDGFPHLRNLLLRQCQTDLNIGKGGMAKLTQLQIYGRHCRIYGLDELLHLRKVDVDDEFEFHLNARSYLPSSFEWSEIRSKNEEGETIWHFCR